MLPATLDTSSQDTIAAIATAMGPSGIGVVRLSGPHALAITQKVIHCDAGRRLEDRIATVVQLRDPGDGALFDEALVTYMAAPNSYTTEDIVEISCHGGHTAVGTTLNALLGAGARLARPGEFTLRAFLNGRIDLIQAEAVADMVSARTNLSLKAAREQLGGRLSRRVRDIREQCLGLLARLEAEIDFSEDDVPAVNRHEAKDAITSIVFDVRQALDHAEQGQLLRTGVRVAIVGSPNVGKSSLLNALLRYDRAIVTDTPGTTRDTLEEQVDINGIAFVVVDTAGIRGTVDSVESEGINRARKALFEADVALLVLDSSRGLEESDYAVANLIIEHGLPALVVLNKSDLPQQLFDEITIAIGLDCPAVQTCAINDHEVESLRVALSNLVNTDNIQAGDFPLVTNERHREALQTAEYHLSESKRAVVEGLPADFISIGLHGVVRILGEITGDDASEDLLAAIFTKFCIGK